MSGKGNSGNIEEEIKQLAASGISFNVASDGVVIYMDMKTLIDVALVAFKQNNLSYTYEIDSNKQIVKVKIPVESLREFIKSNAKDPSQLSIADHFFSMINQDKS